MKIRTLVTIILVFVNATNILALTDKLSEKAQVSLITYGPGKDLYSVFGHTAIRINDPANEIDLTFNYGTFDFDTPNFYLKFIRGNLNYFLTIADFKRSVLFYISANRSVNELILNYTPQQKQILYSSLIENYKPENRSYKYDFFFDNCATRIRDMLINASGKNYEFKEDSTFNSLSYRDLLKPYIEHSPWLDLGINLALGLPSDNKAKVWGSMYLPDYLKQGFEKAIIRLNEKSIPYISNEKMHYNQREIIKKNNYSVLKILTPTVVFSLLLILSVILTFFEFRKRLNFIWFDKILFGLVGALGLLITILWLATEHDVMNNNLNIFWAMPLHIIIAWPFAKDKLRKFHFYYFLIYCIILLVLLLTWKVFPQPMHNYLLPLIMALFVRSFNKIYQERKQFTRLF